MKVFLINPPAVDGVRMVREGRCMQRAGAWTAVWAPVSLALTGGMLEADGHEVRLTDCIVEGVNSSEMAAQVAAFRPDLVVLNAATPSIDGDLDRARIIKQVMPGARVAAFGIHVTALPEQSLNSGSEVDFVIRGEPESTVKDLVHAGLNPKGVPGISWRDGNEGYVHEPDREPIADLDSLHFPAWHLVDRKRYIMPFTDRRFLLIATGRGCPHRCAFCADPAFYGRKLRLRSPEKVAEEMEYVGTGFGIRDFLFWSESFTLNRDYAVEVCEAILKRGLKTCWVANSRVDDVDPELLRLMKRAGCWVVGYGVEAGTDKSLKMMRKNVTVEQIRRAIEWTVDAGIGAVAHTIIGYPGETEDEVNETIRFVKSLPLDFAQFYCAVPFPGSPLFDEAQREGWINTRDWSRFEQNHSVLDTPWLSARKVMELREKAFREFYLRPRAFVSAARYVQSPGVALRMARMLWDFGDWIRIEG